MSRLDPSTWPLLRRLSKTDRIVAVMIIATAFFLADIVVGFRNKSLALVGDAFHISSDIIAYGVALIATRMGQTRDGKIVPAKFSFGYQRAELLGGLFNGGESATTLRARLTADQRSSWPSANRPPIDRAVHQPDGDS